MTETAVVYPDYLPVGDTSVLALCFLITILFLGTFVHRNTQYRQLRYCMVCIFAATLANLSYHQLLADSPYPVSPQLITVIRDINCLLYQFTMLIYVDYILRLVLVTGRERRRIRIVAGVGFITFAIFQLLGHFFHYGFYVDSTGELHNGARLSFAIAFIFFTSLISYNIIYTFFI